MRDLSSRFTCFFVVIRKATSIKLPERRAVFWFVSVLLKWRKFAEWSEFIEGMISDFSSLLWIKGFLWRHVQSGFLMHQMSTKSKSRHKSCICFTEFFLKGLPPEQSRSESSGTLKSPPRIILSSSLTTQSSIFFFNLSKKRHWSWTLFGAWIITLTTKMANIASQLQL